MTKKERAIACFNILNELYPNVGTFLTHNSSFQLLIAVIMSAQCTDIRVNKVTPDLFDAYPTSKALAGASFEHVRELIKSVNFCNAKALNIINTAVQIEEKFKGIVPSTLKDLITLPGVGRKTANVVLGQAFNTPGITADTHVKRVSYRLGFTKQSDPTKVEFDLMKVWPKKTWIDFSSITILHGRDTCLARAPKCSICKLQHLCDFFKKR